MGGTPCSPLTIRERRRTRTANDEIMIHTLEWTQSGVVFIDQTKLPTQEGYVTCTTHEQVADAIRNMIVRGAPPIDGAAALGIAVGVQKSQANNFSELKKESAE